MKLFIMTDLEGVSCVLDHDNWLGPKGMFYGTGRRLLTEELNAAVRAFAENGFDEIVVHDGHGAGSVDAETVNPRVKILRGVPLEFGPYTGWPMGMDESFDALAFVGQHAKAGTEYSHLTHTGNMNMIDISINGVSVGEYGQLVLCAGERGVPVIFAAGEKALCLEAEALTPWVVTAAVKEGNIPGRGDDLTTEAYCHFHEGAVHLSPTVARALIYEKATAAAQAFHKKRSEFKPLTLQAPYRVTAKIRPSIAKNRPSVVSVEATDDNRMSSAFNRAKEKIEKVFRGE